MRALGVSTAESGEFWRADLVFQHQVIWDGVRQRHLFDLCSSQQSVDFLGSIQLDPRIAHALALGRLNPMTLEAFPMPTLTLHRQPSIQARSKRIPFRTAADIEIDLTEEEPLMPTQLRPLSIFPKEFAIAGQKRLTIKPSLTPLDSLDFFKNRRPIVLALI